MSYDNTFGREDTKEDTFGLQEDNRNSAPDNNNFAQSQLFGQSQALGPSQTFTDHRLQLPFQSQIKSVKMLRSKSQLTLPKQTLSEIMSFTQSNEGMDSQGPIEASRRYSEFFMIRRILVMRWPGCYIPAVPPKNTFKNTEPTFVQQRKAGLDLFLQKVSALPHLHYSREYQTFLRFNGADLLRELKAYERIVYDEIIERYAATFHHLADIPSVSDAAAMTSKFKVFLTKSIGRFRTFKATTKEIAKAKKKYYEGMTVLQTKVAAEYEKDVISEYDNQTNVRSVFYAAGDVQMDEKVAKMKAAMNNNSIEYFDIWMGAEIQELETLMEAIQHKDKYERAKNNTQARLRTLNQDLQDLNLGHFSFKNLFSSKSKEAHIADINAKIIQCNKDIESLTKLIDMITIVIAHDEIDKFKNKKSEKFYQLIQLSGRNELENINTVIEYWNFILSRIGNIAPL